ncbi:hypothetical protein GCM10022243_67970 [Saccharothrix violaceirubra]
MPVGCAQHDAGDAQPVVEGAHLLREAGVVPVPAAFVGHGAAHAVDGSGAEFLAAVGAEGERHRPVDARPRVSAGVVGEDEFGEFAFAGAAFGELFGGQEFLPVDESVLVDEFGAETARRIAASGQVAARRACRDGAGSCRAPRRRRGRPVISHERKVRRKGGSWHPRFAGSVLASGRGRG